MTTSPSPLPSTSPDSGFSIIAASAPFQTLVRARRRFVQFALAAGLGWFTVFLVLTAWHPPFMGWSLHGGLTVAYALGLSQFVTVWLITWAYLRRSQRMFGPLEEAALATVSSPVVIER